MSDEDKYQNHLTKLQEFLSHLNILREDRTVYIRSEDVLRSYDFLCQQVCSVDRDDINIIFRDCLLLVSLFFLTVGKNNEPPASYAALVVIKRLLYHLTESGNYSSKDIIPIEQKLAELKGNIENRGDTHPHEMISLLRLLVSDCYATLKPLKEKISQISPELQELHEKLVSIRRSIKGCEARSTFALNETIDYKHQLNEIESQKAQGKFLAPDGSEPLGLEIVLDLLSKCKNLAHCTLERQGLIDASLRPIAEQLFKLRSHLEKLSVTQAWSLRETDLYDYITQVQEIDNSRVGVRFVNEEGNTPENGQSTLLYLVRRCYMYIFSLLVSSEPVSEALTPVYNQLQTVRHCLIEVQNSGGISSSRDLYPYAMKLASIDNMRVDGKFMVERDIPEGQGRVNSLLAECFETMADLRSATDNSSDS